jgi:alpha-L-rhamnosidase
MKPTLILCRFIVVWIFCQFSLSAASGGIVPIHFRCEYLKNPLGIDVQRPRLSWQLKALDSTRRGLKQSAYQILVASNLENLEINRGDFCDTGQQLSDQTLHVEYAGKALSSQVRCFWKVRVWDQEGKASFWSEPALWSWACSIKKIGCWGWDPSRCES